MKMWRMDVEEFCISLAGASDDSHAASGTSSEEDVAELGSPPQSATSVSPEQIIIDEVQGIIDSSHAVKAEQMLLSSGRWAGCLQAHVQSLFAGNTEESTRMKLGDWTLYCKLMYKGRIPEVKEIQWPPNHESWVSFLLQARVQVSSYKRFQGVVGNICEVANRFWSQELGVLKESVDPRVLYSAIHSRTMTHHKKGAWYGGKASFGCDYG